LPFTNLSGDPNLDVFGEGITEDVLTELSKLRELVLIASGLRLIAKSTTRDAREIGREIGARYVLEGSVRAAGFRMRVTGRLIDTTTAVQIWGQQYDLDRGRDPAFHDEIAEAIISAILPAIRHADLKRSQCKSPEQLGVWEAYQRGLWQMSKSEAAENKLARSLFQRAVDLDPNFGRGYGAIAFTYTAASSAFSEMSIAESCELAEPLVRKALGPLVPLIWMELTGLVWLAVEGFNSRIVNVALFAPAVSAEKTARFPAVNAARTSIGEVTNRAETDTIVAPTSPRRFSAME